MRGPRPGHICDSFVGRLHGNMNRRVFSHNADRVLNYTHTVGGNHVLNLVTSRSNNCSNVFIPFLNGVTSAPGKPTCFSHGFGTPVIPVFVMHGPSNCNRGTVMHSPVRCRFANSRGLSSCGIALGVARRIRGVVGRCPSG